MKSGFLLVDKPSDFTSFDVVAILRKKFHTKKIGHSGTLDPMATGLLLVFVNKATNAVSVLPPSFKTYEAGIRFGIATDTEDITGKVTEEKAFSSTRQEVEEALLSFTGDIMQVPPMYSAKKIKGQKLYDLARKGISVERKPVKLHIEKINLLSFDSPEAVIRVTCQKGTYIRTLCKDIGESLGSTAVMTSLRRTSSDSFDVSDAIPLDRLKETDDEKIYDLLQPVDKLFSSYKAFHLTAQGDFYAGNGNSLEAKDFCQDREEFSPEKDEIFRIYSSEGKFLALYRYDGDILKAYKMFLE